MLATDVPTGGFVDVSSHALQQLGLSHRFQPSGLLALRGYSRNHFAPPFVRLVNAARRATRDDLTSLTPGAKVRAPAGDDRAPNRRVANLAALACLSIDVCAELEIPLRALAVDVVADCGPALSNGVREHFLNGLVQTRRPFGPDLGAVRAGVDAGTKKRFVGVDVSQAAQEFLIEKQRLEHAAARAKAGAKLVL